MTDASLNEEIQTCVTAQVSSMHLDSPEVMEVSDVSDSNEDLVQDNRGGDESPMIVHQAAAESSRYDYQNCVE